MSEKKLLRPRTYEVYAPADLSKRWFVFWYDQDGKRIRRDAGINTHKTVRRRRKAAEALIEKIKRQYKAIKYVSNSEKALKAELEAGRGRWSKTTYEEYGGILNKLLVFLNGREITEALLRAYMAKIQIEYKSATWNKHRHFIHSLLEAMGLPDHWWDALKPLKINSTPARYFQSYQATQLGSTIQEEHPDLWLYIQFMFYTFIRPKELRGLKAGDVLLDAREIRVPDTISKNGKTQYVAIPDIFLKELEFVREMSPGSLLFTGRNGKPLGKNTMYQRHLVFLKRLEFGTEYTLYSWKHTGAVALAQAGVSIKEIQLQMRHHSLDQTDQYLRQLGIRDVVHLRKAFPHLLRINSPQDTAVATV
jgi:integrase